MKNLLWDTHTKIHTIMGHIEKQLWDRAYLGMFQAILYILTVPKWKFEP